MKSFPKPQKSSAKQAKSRFIPPNDTQVKLRFTPLGGTYIEQCATGPSCPIKGGVGRKEIHRTERH